MSRPRDVTGRVLYALRLGQATAPELANLTGLSYDSVQGACKRLVREGNASIVRQVKRPMLNSRMPRAPMNVYQLSAPK